MKDELKILDALNEMDDDLLEAAEQDGKNGNRSKKMAGKSAVGAAVAACLAIIIGIVLFRGKGEAQIIYADSLNEEVFYSQAPDGKVEMAAEFGNYEDNALMRTIVIIYDYEPAYQEIYGKTYEFTEEMASYVSLLVKNRKMAADEVKQAYTVAEMRVQYNKLCELYEEHKIDVDVLNGYSAFEYKAEDELQQKALQREKEWLERIGAKDVQKLGFAMYIITIRNEELAKLESGRCKYRSVLAPKECTEEEFAEMTDMKRYYGTYEHAEFVYMPLISSFLATNEAVESMTLTLNEDLLQVASNGYTPNATITNPVYAPIRTKRTADNYYGFDEMAFLFGGEKMMELITSDFLKYDVSGDRGRVVLYFTKDSVYVDLSLQGIYKFSLENRKKCE